MLPVLLFQWLTLTAPAPMVAGADCAEAARTRIEAPRGFDAVRVTTAPGQPGASVTVSVTGGDRWASLTAREGGASLVALEPTETGGMVTVAIEPDLDARAGACVRSIELLRNGAVIATVAPR